jgi:hypothetical protein
MVAVIVVVICIVGVMYFAATAALVSCTVCMAFNGRTECSTATSTSQPPAAALAIRSACGALATGRAETAACVQSKPVSQSCR